LAIAPSPDHLSAREASEQQRCMVAEDLLDGRFERDLSERDIAWFKSTLNRWVVPIVTQHVIQIQPFLHPHADPQAVREALQIKLFDGIETIDREMSQAKRGVPYLEPRVTTFASKHVVVGFRLADLLIRKLVHDPEWRRAVISKSDEWKRGEKYMVKPPEDEELFEMDDAVEMRLHPDIMRPATDDEIYDIRVGLLANQDDVEVSSDCCVSNSEPQACES
jgi:hypothetical protein